jgi:hypothetical protein
LNDVHCGDDDGDDDEIELLRPLLQLLDENRTMWLLMKPCWLMD